MSKQERTVEVVIRGEAGNFARVNSDHELLVHDMSGGGGGSGAVSLSTFVSLSNLNTNLDATAGRSATSARSDCSSAREFALAGKLEKTGTPTDILFKVFFATNTTTSAKHQHKEDYWADLRWDDVAVGSGITFHLTGKCVGQAVDVFVTMTGANTFTLSEMTLYLRD